MELARGGGRSRRAATDRGSKTRKSARNTLMCLEEHFSVAGVARVHVVRHVVGNAGRGGLVDAGLTLLNITLVAVPSH